MMIPYKYWHRKLLGFVRLLVPVLAISTTYQNSGQQYYKQHREDQQLTCKSPPLKINKDVIPFHASKVVIAHRGASAHLPEHSLPAYRLALSLGADYIEPDIVSTKDGHLIAIHSVDLNLTTDVATVFPHRATKSSFRDDEVGFWSYEFTLQEIKQLKVRQRLPQARPTTFDYLFSIPTLSEILELVRDWQEEQSPLLWNGTHRHAGAGIYLELKDSPWILKDTGVDLVDLFFDHLLAEDSSALWEAAVLSRMCSTQNLHAHEYDLPPLIMQSFEVPVLKAVHDRWKSISLDQNNSILALYPTLPPMIALVSAENCHDEKFWFNLGENYHATISGIGPDKTCLLNDDGSISSYRGQDVMDRARKWGWVVHPWTIRPELQFTKFHSEKEELYRLFCDFKVDAVFSESVSAAIQVAAMDCSSVSSHSGDIRSSAGTHTSSNINTTPSHMVPLLASLIMLLAFLLIVTLTWSCCSNSSTGIPRRKQHTAVSVVDDDCHERSGDDEEYHVEIT